MSDGTPERVELLGAGFDPLTLEGTTDAIFDLVNADERGWLCTTNVAILMMMRDDPFLCEFVNAARFNVADGMPLIWATRLRGPRLPERVTGVDLVEVICERAARDKTPIYLLGAKQDILDKVAERLQADHPELPIAGTGDGYFTKDEFEARAKAVADSGAKILIVAMGVPRQEHFISEQWENLGVNFAIGVGGSFDVLSGLRSRAPVWIQKIGMEWAYRLMQEPRRLFRRYLVTNTRFMLLLVRDLLSPRRRNADRKE